MAGLDGHRGAGTIAGELRARVARDAGAARDIVDSNPGRYSWRWYGTPRARDRMRADAAQEFLADLALNPGCYLAGALLRLPFASHSFNLATCSWPRRAARPPGSPPRSRVTRSGVMTVTR